MLRLVLDTNVIVSALLFDGIPEKVVLETLIGKAKSITSPFIIEEVSRILGTKFGTKSEDIQRLQKLLATSEIQYFQPFLTVVKDDPDNRILETAIRGKADCIITGDKLLLKLGSYRGIKIVKPADFLDQD